MRLTSVRAVRYGALEGACLTGLNEGLTVVLGPNESGKTTMTALTRHILYGYPDGRTKERGYAPPAGGRDGALTFANDLGEWVIERVEGKNRGPASVKALRGPARPELLGDLVAGVSEQTYRVVFGFGLDELAEIEKGDNSDIVSRLYAAGTGLAVNPMDARKDLSACAAELYSKGAQKPIVNSLAARQREIKGKIGALEAMAVAYAGDQQRLSELAEALEPLRLRRDTLDARLAVLEQDVARLTDVVAEGEQLESQLVEQDYAIKDAQRALDMVDVDDRILAAAPKIAAVLAGESGFRAHAEAATNADASADEAQRRAAAITAPPQAVDSAENRAAVEGWRDRIATLRAKALNAEDTARQAEARAQATSNVVATSTSAPAPSSSRVLLVGLAAVLFAVGCVLVAYGIVQRQLAAAGLGGVAALVGFVALVAVLIRPPSTGAPGQSLDAEAARQASEAQAARLLADATARDLEASQAEWRAWLADRCLDSQGDDPVAVRGLLDAVAERQRLVGDSEREAALAKRERDAAETWVVQLVDAVRPYDASAAQIPALSEAGALAARARHDIERTRDAEAERIQLKRDLETLQTEGLRLAERLEATRGVASSIAGRHGLSAEAPLASLNIALQSAREDRTHLRESFDSAASEHSALAGKLDNEGRGDAMARARQELEAVRVEAAEAADRYIVAALAVRLIDRARERFERERQPQVVRTAARVFSAMTDRRYTDVRVPLDGSGISVVARDGTVRTTSELSRGTAEQLYLALRVGLIGALGDLGASLPVLMDDVVVNFDDDRRSGAVAAIAELSAMRQVIFFTCHPEVAAAVTTRVTDSTLITLDRCELPG